MKKENKISIIMSIYKETKEELKSSIESILNQTYQNFEFIILVDNPEEKWRIDYIKSFNDDRLKLIINEKNIGLPQSLNKGLGIATGKYIARMDADDISLKNRLEVEVKYLEENNYDLIGSAIECFWEEEKQKTMFFPENEWTIKKIVKIQNCIAHPTWLAKKEMFEDLKGYRNIFSCEDYDFVLRALLKDYKISNVSQVLLKYKLSPNSISRKNSAKQDMVADFLRKKYIKGEIAELKQIEDFLNSKKYLKNIRKLEKYNNIKIKRARCKSKKILKYYYTLLLALNLKFFLKDIFNKIYYNFIIFGENK